MDPLTNLVGAVLVVLSVETQPITDTNQTGISCKEAGCTDTGTVGEVQIETEPAYTDPACLNARRDSFFMLDSTVHAANCKCRPAQYRTEKTVVTWHMHTSNIVTCVATQTTITVGARPAIIRDPANRYRAPDLKTPLPDSLDQLLWAVPLYKVIFYDITPEGKARGIEGNARVEGVR